MGMNITPHVPLSQRVKPNCEVADWVHSEIVSLEERVKQLSSMMKISARIDKLDHEFISEMNKAIEQKEPIKGEWRRYMSEEHYRYSVSCYLINKLHMHIGLIEVAENNNDALHHVVSAANYLMMIWRKNK